MPKDTFFRISEEKRNRIINAIEDEFGRTTLDNAKISNIVKDSGIARGSFYQYFEDITDAFFYITESFTLYHEQNFINILKDSNGDIFEAIRKNVITNFDDMINPKRRRLFRNIHISIDQNNIDPKDILSKLKDIRNIIVSHIKDYNKNPDKERLLYILKDIQWRVMHKSFKRNFSLEEALEELDLNLQIVKYGVQ